MHAHYMHTFLGCMHTMCRLFWVHAQFFQTLKIPPFSPSFTGSFRIPVSLIGLITSPTSLDRNSKVLFLVVLKGLKSLKSLHGVHEVCMGLPPEGEALCAVTGLFPCYKGGQPHTNLVCVKAGVLNLDQLKTNMLVFSHGSILNHMLWDAS
jgi:hypothetical protein